MPFIRKYSHSLPHMERDRLMDFLRLHGTHREAFVCYDYVARVLEGILGLNSPVHASHALSNGSLWGMGFWCFSFSVRWLLRRQKKRFLYLFGRGPSKVFSTHHASHPLFRIYIPQLFTNQRSHPQHPDSIVNIKKGFSNSNTQNRGILVAPMSRKTNDVLPGLPPIQQIYVANEKH